MTNPVLRITRRGVITGLAVVSATACTSLDPFELNRIGSQVEQGDVDFGQLLAFAERAQDSHKTEDELRSIRPNVVRVAEVEHVKVRYILERNPETGHQSLAFPGSVNLSNWLEDFEIFLEHDSSVRIPLHKGFEDATIAAYADIAPHLDKNATIDLTGHSHGAAIAAIMLIYLKRDGYKVERAVTFGQPRITTSTGAAALADLPITRVVNLDDFISMVPTFPFVHFGEEVLLHAGTNFTFLTHEEAHEISIGELWREERRLDVNAHDLDLYINRLREKRSAANGVPYLQR